MNALHAFALGATVATGLLAGTARPTIPATPTIPTTPAISMTTQSPTLQLGNFSLSLAVKDIRVSKAFYEKLDFKEVGGNLEQNWLVLQNGPTTIGLFQGMFERNLLTFNPGWNAQKETLDEFQDVRELQQRLKERGVTLTTEAEDGDGPAHFTLVDPDGNPILVDQHVPRPKG